MRVNLNCPYSEKDEAKALGAKWDSEKKVWYVVGVKDLTPFSKWIPLLGRISQDMRAKKKDHHAPKTTGVFRPICDCTSPPWEECEHSEALATQAQKEMLDQLF